MSNDYSGDDAPRKELIVGTRQSRLALWQTNQVISRLTECCPSMRWVSKNFETFGDSNLDSPLPEMGGKGAFTEELDRALLEGRIDLAVHSLKDLLVDLPKGIKIGAILDRVEPRDVLICQRRSTLDQLPAAAVVGTSSLRRQAQLLNARPDLSVKSIRGNVPTRIDKVITGQYDAVVLAGAGVIRLGLEEKISEWLPLEVMLPAPGQGALAVTCRDSDTQLIASLALIHDPVAAICVDAERQFLAAFGGGCSAPIAACAIAISTVPIEIKLTGRVASVDGQQMMTRETIGKDPEILACDLARQLIECGAMRIIADWQRRLATLNPRLHIK